MFKKIHNKFKEEIHLPSVIILFLCYVLILLWIIILKYNNPKTINVLIEGYLKLNLHERFMFQFSHYTSHVDPQAMRQLFLNIPVFIPFGLLLPLLFKKQNMLRDTLIAFLFSIAIEITQLFTALGGFEFYDLAMNLLGSIIGSLIYLLCRKHIKDVIINYIVLVFNSIAIPFTLFIIINTIINYQLYTPFLS